VCGVPFGIPKCSRFVGSPGYDSSPLMPMNFLAPFSMGWVVVYWLAIGIVHVFFALAVLRDAQRREKLFHRGTFIVSPGLWALATLVSGILGVAVYWLIHHSTLRPPLPVERD
jgi:hypothetical protein